METGPLKSFATWARTELIKEVVARISAVLAPGSSERVEEAAAVKALETAINAAGGDAAGRAKIGERAAYTWFNRIIALRFMDANGYTAIGVVSPDRGQVSGQPEVLADAKRGVIDSEVVGKGAAKAIGALLDGTRRSSDPQGEAYSLLLAEYCRYWHRSMPFMFEREGDYTELLMPANLLADDSVLARAVAVLTEDVCLDVEVIGWLYQFYISERKDEVFAGFKKNKKAGADEIPAATQLFTPHWIVRYLVENSVGRLWMLNHPESRLIDQMDFYIAPVDDETDFLKIARPEELTVIDPACGSGHMLTYAFDLLYAIYEEQGYAPSDIPGLILTHNLYGTEIDQRAGSLAALALTMKAAGKRKLFLKNAVEPNICVLEPITFTPDDLDFLVTRDGDRHAEDAFWNRFAEADTLGSLLKPDPALTVRLAGHVTTLTDGGDILKARTLDWAHRVVRQAEYLASGYSVTIANPPYMGGKNMSAGLAGFAKDHYPDSKGDLFAMFIERCAGFAEGPGALVAMITMQSWMFLSSFEAFRGRLLTASPPACMAHLGERAFDSIAGAVVSTTAFVLEVGRSLDARGSFQRVIEGRNEAEKSLMLRRAVRGDDPNLFLSSGNVWMRLPGTPIVYWLSKRMREAFSVGRPLREVAEPRKGMDTGDNARFLRAWWEVSREASSLTEFRTGSWVPYNKGGGFRRWYGYREFLLDWRNGGTEMRTRSGARYFGQEGWTWGTVTSGGLSIRYTPPGAAFDNGGCTLFSSMDLSAAALILNSSTADAMLAAISPTLNFQPINIGAVPLVQDDVLTAEAGSTVEALIAPARTDWDSFETSWDFTVPWWTIEAGSARAGGNASVRVLAQAFCERWGSISRAQQQREAANNRCIAELYGLSGEVPDDVPLHRVSLTRNVEFRYGPGKSNSEYASMERADLALEIVSYAIGCMFGRYSLDEPGRILSDQRATMQDYLSKVPTPTFAPDADNVIPIVEGDWFEDDIVERFRQFLRAAFGEQHFEENLRFVTESLGVNNLRDYFVKSFYKDHVQRYKKRPIYWLFSSPKGSFNALIYMHRYAPSTVSTVLNEYLREFQAKLQASLVQAERANNAREADRLRKVLIELNEYEHDVLYPLATRQIAIDLDDGVKVNYPKFGAALRKIPGLEASGE